MKRKLGQILVDAGAIDEFQLKSALGFQNKWGGRLGRVLVEHRFLTEEALVNAIHEQTGIPVVNVVGRSFPEYLIKLVPKAMAEEHNLLPVSLEPATGQGPETLVVAMADPTNLGAMDELRFKTGKRVQAVLAGENAIRDAIELHYGGPSLDNAVEMGSEEISNADIAVDMEVVQGSLEQQAMIQEQAPTAAAPAAPVVDPGDPFAELDSIGMDVIQGQLDQGEPIQGEIIEGEIVEGEIVEGEIVEGEIAQDGPLQGEDPFAELDSLALDVDVDMDVENEASAAVPEAVAQPFSELDEIASTAPPAAAAPATAVPQAVDQPFSELEEISAEAPPKDLGLLDGDDEPLDLGELVVDELGTESPDLDQPADLSGAPDLDEDVQAAPLDSFPEPASPAELAEAEALASEGMVGEVTFDFGDQDEEEVGSLDADEAEVGQVQQVQQVMQQADQQEAMSLDLDLGSELDEVLSAVEELDFQAPEPPPPPPPPPAKAAPEEPAPAPAAEEPEPAPAPAAEEPKGTSSAMAALLSRVGLGDKEKYVEQGESETAAQMDALVESVSGEFEAVVDPAEEAAEGRISLRQELTAAGVELEADALKAFMDILVRRGLCGAEQAAALLEED